MKSRIACCILALACATPSLAANLGADIPFAHFTDKDREIFQEALAGALDKGADGVAVAWSNPESKAHGSIKPTKTFERAGAPCRTATIENHAKGRSAKTPFTLCKDAAGKWQVAKK